MSLINPLEEWAADADLTQSYDSQKVSDGWAVGEPPHNKKWNRRENDRDVMINHIKDHSENMGTASPVLTRAALCSQLTFGHDWSNVNNGLNFYDSGDDIRDACLCMAASDKRPYIAYLQTDGTLSILTRNDDNPCWNFDGTFGKQDIEITYPSTPNDVHSIACDGSYLYIAWSTDSGHIRVSAFSLNSLEGSASWTCDTLIDFTGGTEDWTKLIVADSTSLSMISYADPGRFQVTTITKATGVLIGTGTGSYASGYGDRADRRVRPISFVLHTWWIQWQTNGANRDYYLMSAKHSDPTTSTYASKALGSFVTADGHTHPKALVQVNNGIAVLNAIGEIAFYEPYPDSLVTAFAATVAEPDPNYEGDQDVLSAHDGLNIWFSSAHSEVGPVINPVLYKIPVGPFAIVGASSAIDIQAHPVVIDGFDGVSPGVEPSDSEGRLLFDGRHLWYIKRNGMFFRITNPGAR
jgi:hypothetical protein